MKTPDQTKARNGGTDPAEHSLITYGIHRKKRIVFLTFLLMLICVIFVLSISMGSVRIPPSDVISSLMGNGTSLNEVIVWNIRMPRAVSAILAGAGLAVSGAAMQSLLKNPIASPFTLGITHASAFGAAFAIVVLGAGSHQSAISDAVTFGNPYLISICAFLSALAITGIIIFLARVKGTSPETMILAGVAMGSLCIAGTNAIQYFASDVQISSIIFWTFGDMGRTSWAEIRIMAAVVIPAAVFFLFNSWNYNALDSGDDVARSLGVNVDRVRMAGLVAASLVTALIVSFVGIIGFVGLVVPHMVRRIMGGDQRHLMVGCMLLGATLLLLSDTVARLVIAPAVLPVGILTAFMGAPLFLYLIVRGKGYW